jgi:acyl dehydratase
MPAHRQFFFEDVTVGDILETPAVTLTAAHASLYRGISQEAADDPSLIPDLLPLCLSTGLGWRVPQPPLAVLAFMSLEWEIIRPARVGDTIHSRSKTMTKRSMRDGGVVIEQRDIIDQRGEVVQRGRFTFLVAKRPA